MSVNGIDPCLQIGYCVAPLMPFITGDGATQTTLTGKLIANEMYQWVRDNVDIPGATSATYNPTPDDVGHLLRVRMFFTDADNNYHSGLSKPVGPIKSGGAYYLNAGTFATNAGGSSISVPMPANLKPGNLILVYLAGSGAIVTATAVAGWTFANTAVASNFVIAYRIVDGSEPASVTFGFSGAVNLVGQSLQFFGVNAATPIGASNTNSGSGTTASNAGIATGTARSLVLGLIQANINQAVGLPTGFTDAAGTANNVSAPFASGTRAATKFVAAAGPSGALSATIGSSSWRVSLYELISA